MINNINESAYNAATRFQTNVFNFVYSCLRELGYSGNLNNRAEIREFVIANEVLFN